MTRNKTIDMTTGSIFKKLIIFALPLIATNLLQVLFNLADVAVLGIFVPDPILADNTVAAVGSNTPLINLIIALFVGLSLGSNVVIAKYIGQRDKEKIDRGVGSSLFIALSGSLILMVVGFFGARTFLIWMSCNKEIIDLAEKYLKIYFLGMPAIMLYNFSAAILRADGDTFHPMLFITIGGVINVILNILFVACFNMYVEGVAIATVASQLFASIACLIVLFKNKGNVKFNIKHLRFYKEQVADIFKIGVPSGVQSAMFSISNVIIQTAINKFSPAIITANTIAVHIDNIIFFVGYGFAMATLSFVGQNLGACKFDRLKKVPFVASLWILMVSTSMSALVVIFSRQICGILTETEEVIRQAQIKIYILSPTYFLCALMQIYENTIKGLGKAFISMVISILCTCVFRVVYIDIALKYLGITPIALKVIYWVYPISWFIPAVIEFVIMLYLFKKLPKTDKEDSPNQNLQQAQGEKA